MSLKIIPAMAGLYYIMETRPGKRQRRVAYVERFGPIGKWSRSWRVTWKDMKAPQFFHTLHDLGNSVDFINKDRVYMAFLTKDRYNSYKNGN